MALSDLVDPVCAHQTERAHDGVGHGCCVSREGYAAKLAALGDADPRVGADEVVADGAVLVMQLLSQTSVAGTQVDNEGAGGEVGLEGGNDEV